MRTLSRLGRIALLAIAWATLTAPAWAQHPDHPIKLIVPVPPGGGVDILARAIGQKMSLPGPARAAARSGGSIASLAATTPW